MLRKACMKHITKAQISEVSSLEVSGWLVLVCNVQSVFYTECIKKQKSDLRLRLIA